MSETVTERTIPENILKGDFLYQLSSLTHNTLPEGCSEDISFEEALFAWADGKIPEDQRELFRSLFSVEALKTAYGEGKTNRAFEYDDPGDETQFHRLSMHLVLDGDSGDLMCVSTIKDFEKEQTDTQAMDSLPFRAVIRTYQLFFSVNPEQPHIVKSSVYKDQDKISETISMPCSYRSFLKAVGDKYVRAAWEDEFLGTMAIERVQEAISRGQKTMSHTFSSDMGPLRMDVFLPGADDEDKNCYFGLGSAGDSGETGLTVTAQDGAAMHATLEDMQLSMQMEREETKKKHRRGSIVLALLTVIIGLTGGSVLMQKVPEYAAFLARIFPPAGTEEPTETPPPPEEVEVVVPDTVVEYVGFTKALEFKADLMENGLPSTNASYDKDETVTVTMTVLEKLTADWFAKEYAKGDYTLDGTENGVRLTLSFTGADDISSVVPQESFPMRLTDAEGNTITGYQLMDKPIDGKYNVKVSADTETELYKRCEGVENALYLAVDCWRDGVPYEYRFALQYDDPNAEQDEIKMGDKGDAVLAMKQKLVALGYLSEKATKTSSFNGEVQKAVKAAQADFGMDQTGVADSAFLKTLYSK